MNKNTLTAVVNVALFFMLMTGFSYVAFASSITVENSNFISTPTNFNGFEGIGTTFFQDNTVYSEGGINVEYIGTDGNGHNSSQAIWTTLNSLVNSWGWGLQGQYSWYPNGGGDGYTAITLSNNADFQNIQFLLGSGFGGAHPAQYQLLENGIVVSTGTVQATTDPVSFVGFSGSGFNQVDIQVLYNGGSYGGSFNPTGYEAAAIDSISVQTTTTPIPATIWLVGSALTGLVGFIRRKRRS